MYHLIQICPKVCILTFLQYPNHVASEHPLDLPETTLIHARKIVSKAFLKRWYIHSYTIFTQTLKHCPPGIKLEIGSGGGFFKIHYPEIKTSDILTLPDLDFQLDAQQLPFQNSSLAGIVMLNVFHHIPNPGLFLNEANRCLKVHGKLCMIEPANTWFSRFIYKRFHHEPFDEKGPLQIAAGRPLSHSNQALAYIYFIREKKRLSEFCPQLKITKINYYSPLGYLISGGLSKPALLPSFMFPVIRFLEFLLTPLHKYLALFYIIELEAVNT